MSGSPQPAGRQYHPDPIVAPATPWGQSALAVLRVSGRGCLELLSRAVRPAGRGGEEAGLGSRPGHTLHRGYLIDPAAAEGSEGKGVGWRRIDEVLVAVYRAPRSYTGEDSAEIFTHGNPVILRRALEVLQGQGFRLAEPGEFTLRAFLNRKLDLTQAEAVNEIVRARTDRARAIALNRLSGAIERQIDALKAGVVRLLAAVEVRLDYPEEELGLPEEEALGPELSALREEVARLLATYRTGRLYQEGISVVLAGRTNAGKSTLFNRLLREDRAIVSEVHGTTRDYLEGTLELEGIPVRLYDTAGYRSVPAAIPGDGTTVGWIEGEGIRRTDSIVRSADLILYLVDAAAGASEADREFLEAHRQSGRLIGLWSRSDLAASPPPEGLLPVSAVSGEGLPALLEAISERAAAGMGTVGVEEPIIDSLRQKRLLERTAAALEELHRGAQAGVPLDALAVDLREALDALGEITGEVTSREILAGIFNEFCVGK